MSRRIAVVLSFSLLLSTPMAAAQAPSFQELIEQLAAQNQAAPRVQLAHGQTSPRLISGLQLALPGDDPVAKSEAFLRAYRSLLLPGDQRSQLKPTRQVAAPFGPVVQWQQQLDGLPVFGASLVTSFDQSGRLRLVVNGTRPLQAAGLLTDLVSAERAIELARAAYAGPLRGDARHETVWLTGGETWLRAHLVTVLGANPMGDFSYLILGPKGRIAWRFERTPGALGYAYPSNPVRDVTWQQVELPYLTSAQQLNGQHVEVYNCAGSATGSCATKSQVAPDVDGNYLIEPIGPNNPDLPDDHFVEVQAYYGINTIHDYFVGLGADPTPIKTGVNYLMPPEMGPNAYYSPQEPDFGNSAAIIMGQYQTLDLALDNDVIFHEYGHHVFGQYSSASMFEMDQYGPVFWGLAFNEATADYFSCSALEDPSMGEFFAERMPAYFPDGYLRMVKNDLTCPQGLYGEGHDDGMVWSGFIWELREHFGAGVIDPLYLDVIIHFPSDIDFPSATQVLIERAGLVLDADQVQHIRDRATARGVDTCDRFLEIQRAGHTGFVYGKQILGQMGSYLAFVPAELHYFLDLPANANQLELHLSFRTVVGGADVVLLVRADQPVEHSFSMAGLTSTYDFLLEDDGVFDLSAPQGQFQPGHKYYFHPVNRGQGTTEYTLNGGFTTLEPDGGSDAGPDGGPDGGADGGPDPDGGTDCPDGQEPVIWDSQIVCAPICKDGYGLERQGDSWACVKTADGCGCAAGGNGSALALGLLLLLGFRRRD